MRGDKRVLFFLFAVLLLFMQSVSFWIPNIVPVCRKEVCVAGDSGGEKMVPCQRSIFKEVCSQPVRIGSLCLKHIKEGSRRGSWNCVPCNYTVLLQAVRIPKNHCIRSVSERTHSLISVRERILDFIQGTDGKKRI